MKNCISYFCIGICLLLFSCSQTSTLDQAEDGELKALDFSVITEINPPTIGEFGDTSALVTQGPVGVTKSYIVDNVNLTSMGVFSFFTGTDNFSANVTTGSLPNSMYNVNVSRTNSSSPWAYSPKYYWPATTTNKISFFAYAPHSSASGGAITVSANTKRGVPILSYTVPSLPVNQIDLLLAARRANLTRSTGTVTLSMQHALAKFVFGAKLTSTDRIIISSIQITGLKGAGSIDMETGKNWTTTGSNTSYTLESANLTSEATNLPTNTYAQMNQDESTMFIIPQPVVSGTTNLVIRGTRYIFFLFFEIPVAYTKTVNLSTVMTNIDLGGNYRLNININ